MAKLIYSAITSLDGYIEDSTGKFDWAVPDEEVHRFVNDLVRTADTYLYGRRMYETMMGWETDPSFAAESPPMRDFAGIWQAADKIVYSRTLTTVATGRTRIERDFDPEAIRQLKATTGHDITRRWSRPRHPCVQGRVGRRVPPVPCTHHRGRRETVVLPSMCAWSLNCWRNAALVMAWYIWRWDPIFATYELNGDKFNAVEHVFWLENPRHQFKVTYRPTNSNV